MQFYMENKTKKIKNYNFIINFGHRLVTTLLYITHQTQIYNYYVTKT